MTGKVHRQSHGNVISDDDGFGPYALGGKLNVKFGTFDITNIATAEALLFTLPAGAEIVDWEVAVTETFDAGDSNDLDIGDGTTADLFAADVDLETVGGFVKAGIDPTAMFTPLAADTDVFATYIPAGTAANTGEAVVRCSWILR
jgi:hypothetical protein